MVLEEGRSLMINSSPEDEVTKNIYYEISKSFDYIELEFRPDMIKEEMCMDIY